MPPRSPLTLPFRFWFSCQFCFRRYVLLRLRLRPWLLAYLLLFRSFLLSSVPVPTTQTLAAHLFPLFSFIFAFVGPYYSDSDPGFSSISSFFVLFYFRRSLLLRLGPRPWLLVYDIDSKGKQCKPVCPFCTFLNPISSTDLYIFLLH